MAEPVDFGGTQPRWPARAAARFADCLARASGSADRWRVPAPQGEDLLRERIGERFGLDPAAITITSGVRAAALTYAREHQRIVVERPTFAGVRSVLAGTGTEV